MRNIIFLISFTFISGIGFSQTVSGEAYIKAAFIYNFTKYIEWKEEHLQADFVIGVLGTSAVTTPLAEISRTNKAKNRNIVIRYYNKPEDIRYCNILFIPTTTSYSVETILAHKQKGMLIISEQPGFASQGTALNFITIRNKIKFEANLAAIADAELNASSQLLKLAVIVNK